MIPAASKKNINWIVFQLNSSFLSIEHTHFYIGNIKMLSTAFYERIIGAIGEENLRGLTASQESNLIKRYNKLLNKKGGNLDEISYDDIIEVWMKVS